MTTDIFKTLLRPEVKGVLVKDETIFLATLAGLFQWCDGVMAIVPGWERKPVRAICKAQGGFLAVSGHRLVICDKMGVPMRELPPIPGDEAKSVLVDEKTVFAGGKTGIWRCVDDHWHKVVGEKPFEVIGLGKSDGRIYGLVKKQGVAQFPALTVSADGGDTWRQAWEGSYADLVRGVAGTQIVTQWGGVHTIGDSIMPHKEPTTAAWIGAGVIAKITGSKLELLHGDRVHLEIKMPVLAEAEILQVMGSKALVAGVQGAWLVDLNNGAADDLFAGVEVPSTAAKIKKLFALDAGHFVATTSFGTFVSDDVARNWQLAHSDWRVLDAVGVATEGMGKWWLAAQRGLFQSPDNGQSWKHAKVSGRPHGFAEFTGIAFAAGRLALASKAGLFVSGDGGTKDLQAVPALGRRLITGVVADGDDFLVTDGAGGLHRVSPAAGTVDYLAGLPAKTEPLAMTSDGLVLVCKQGLMVWADGKLSDFALPDAAGEGHLHATASGGSVVVWNDGRAWRRSDAGWVEVPNWPAHAKSAGVLTDGSVLVTDRIAIYRREAA